MADLYMEVSLGEWVPCDDVVMEEVSVTTSCETGSVYNPDGDVSDEEVSSYTRRAAPRVSGWIVIAKDAKYPGVSRVSMSTKSNTMPAGCNKIYANVRVGDRKRTRQRICNILKSRRFGSLGCMFQGHPDELMKMINDARVKMH